MTRRLRVAIVGYGSGGQAAALALARDGHEVEVFERVPNPGPVGAGFLLQPTGLQALWRLGLLDAVRTHGAPVARLYGETPCGRAVMDMRYADLDARLTGIGMQRGALFALLHAAIGAQVGIQLHVDHAVEELDCDAGRLRDARWRWHGPFDVLVVADGSASALRAQVTASRIDKPYPWGALWCLLPEGDWSWPTELRQRYLLARQMAGMLPVGCMPGDPVRRLSFFWSLPVNGFGDWRTAGRDAWMQQLQALWPEAHARMGEDFDVSCLARAAYRDAIPKRWWRGRTVLLGDAAHAMSPQLGQGVNMALVDALELAKQLGQSTSTTDAFAAYETARRAHLAAYHRYSRWLTPLFQSHHDGIARLRDAAFLPAGRLPFASGHMLRVLSGTQQGWFGRYRLEPGFVDALHRASPANQTE
ncbi:MAG: NAD(P)/FAD-dependent oxidoreductase [Thermomonas sp.]|uniref:FAD-dependent oxidoreductase n=1 Tax=Thermomonas sp. TaxID=1971895 RepID=UPI0039E69C00